MDRAKQVGQAVSQIKNGDTAGGAMEAVNAATGTIKGLSENITKRDGTRATMNDIRNNDFKVNNDFYVSGNIRAGFNKSKSGTASHTESAAVTTMKSLNENSSITYNNVNNITYQGTQAQGGTFIYNNVANIQKEAVELRNSYSSESSGFGVGVSAGIGSNGQIKPNGISGNVSANRSNQNTVETVYANGNFKNVNEVHNNTGSMTLSGFNQEGGKVTGNIGKLVVESRQNTSTTTGRSSGIGLGISANGMPSSVNVSGSRTNGNRAFVDNQSSFIVGEGSNLHVGTLENTGAVIGKQSENSTTFKIDNYIAKNIYNEDTMTTTGGSIGASLGGKPRITSAGFNQDSRDKEGITRNTVVGNVEIQNASGDEINRDLSKANEITKDTHSSTNINVEPQVIEYISNPTKFKEDLEVAILEGKATGETVLKSIENAVNGRKSSDIGDPERRTINEIKESIIRVKTAPEMNLIATGDLNSEKILKELDISAVEKYDPDNPNLPPKVRARVDKLAQKGEVPGIFYDKITNKIFVDENITDEAVIRAGIAREWKISEDLKTGKGKENDEGQLKATVAGELAYDDMMKRAREGKTGSISTSELGVAVMDVNSEVTADFNNKHVDKFFKGLGDAGKKFKKLDIIGGFKQLGKVADNTTRVLNNDIKTISKGGPAAQKTMKESIGAIKYAVGKIVPKAKKTTAVKKPKSNKPKKTQTTKKPTNSKTSNNKKVDGIKGKIVKGVENIGYFSEGAMFGLVEEASFGNIVFRDKNGEKIEPNNAYYRNGRSVARTLSESSGATGYFAMGAGLAIAEDATLGVAVVRDKDGKKIEPNNVYYHSGQLVGHSLSTIGGGAGAGGAGAIEVAGIALVPETGGTTTLAIIPAEAVKTYSAGVATKGAFGITESLIKLSNPKNSSNSGGSTNNKNSNNGNTSRSRPTYKQSENDLTKSLKETYKNDPDIEILSQKSYLGKESANYGTKGSVRPDNIKLKNNIPVESFEMKNYKLQNYDNMANTIVKQVEQRRKNLPLTVTKQNIVIDARGQGITAVQEKEIIQKIIDKSNGTIKKSDITIWK